MSSGSSGSGGSGGGGGIPLPVRFAGIVVALPIIIAVLDLLCGNKLLCNLKGVDVGFLKCDNQSGPATPAPSPPLIPSASPETVKQDPIPSSSPTSTSSPTPKTPVPVSPSPLVKISPDEKPCTVDKNGSTENLGFLNSSCTFTGNVSANNLENRYRFKIDNPSNISLFLDGVNSEVEISLSSDKDGTGVMGYILENTSAVKSRTGIIKRELGVGSYIVVVKLKARDTPYSLQIVNNTSQIQNIGYLENKKIVKNGSVSLNNREQFYSFQLANPSSISLSLDGVNSKVEMYLCSDKNGTGVMGYILEDISAINSKPGIIKKELGVGNYIVVVRLNIRDSNYNLTMSAP
jgi:LEA14-like dessication related protein